MFSTILVSDLTKFALAEEAGLKLRKKILEMWDKYDNIIVDFKNINIFATPFFNYSLGYCILNFGPDDYSKKITVINLNVLGEETYKHSIDNAIEFYSKKVNVEEVANITQKTIAESEL